MCRILRFYDNDFRFCEGKILRKNKRSGKWKRCDNLKPNGKGYVRVTLRDDNGDMKMFSLHRIVYKAYHTEWDITNGSMDNSIDHKDGNRTNNHIDNLRVVTNQQNCFNRSSVKGCHYRKRNKKWVAEIRLDGKLKLLGYYKTEEEARLKYLEAKNIYHIIPVVN